MKMNADNNFENRDGLCRCSLPHPFVHSMIQAGAHDSGRGPAGEKYDSF